MLRIPCPVCGLRDETEFTYGADATLRRPDMEETDPGVWHDYVFIRDNPQGRHKEYWHHVSGCRQWILVERDTLTHEIFGSSLVREVAA
ncbi:Sarcosine oxidase subunit delta [Mesorhizobium sp. ORS 3359]|uniref:sarcosine oxidase subunit delta n=1 Tax=Mesorhizobium sp. M1A.F.Ca.ET.072.01.1.1 TaxID=2496753 RepID=UPI0005012057|nr:sarcosine oxidase subunit delta [Mesorhizobium sp. M1A.F.Ca.ET.072.01.1.1]RUW53310.1 sarcosine oxidase subunit delta [Mesorhizobium sp. M1A.F.Ca.ET.072.01.1.1]TIV04024.1 MAG: sarcosine oxidase subunit delta [Mesorhizobium sp.]CDX45062.1 Sarcosine oxidase subunit delta [Mesorhizobium sp. ORS 3359]